MNRERRAPKNTILVYGKTIATGVPSNRVPHQRIGTIMDMNIEILKITPVKNMGKTLAFCKIKVGPFTFCSCPLIDGEHGLWVAMPAHNRKTKKNYNGGKIYEPLVWVDDDDLREDIRMAVVDKWEKEYEGKLDEED